MLTHSEILELDAIKNHTAKFKKQFGMDIKFECTTGVRAYTNGTRKINIPVWRRIDGGLVIGQEDYSIYPDGGYISDGTYTIKKLKGPIVTLEDWNKAIEWLLNSKLSIELYMAKYETSSEILDQLANHSDSEARQYIAGNKNTAAGTLDKLSKRRSEPIDWILIRNNNCSSSTMTRLFNRYNNSTANGHRSFTLCIINHPNATIEMMIDSGLDDAKTLIKKYLKGADPIEKERVDELITLKEMGIPVAAEPLNLKNINI